MNYKLEKFWNYSSAVAPVKALTMNYKLEKFWNTKNFAVFLTSSNMNYKLEKFWNTIKEELSNAEGLWTINLKSFEILKILQSS